MQGARIITPAVALSLVGGTGNHRAATASRYRPLAVDLDHSLVRTDTLHEALVAVLFRRPQRIPAMLWSLRRGRAAFKHAATVASDLDCAALPYDTAVLQLIEERRDAGGEVHLVTAADQIIADDVATALGVFDSATGTSGDNLKGPAKASYLATRYPGGFDYVGDCSADIPVWQRAGTAYLAGGASRLQRRLHSDGIAFERLPRPTARVRTWVKALRLHQWSKNALLFVPLILSHEFSGPAVMRVAVAWLLFGLIASATYLLNDLSDLGADRSHPSKRFRALAAGLIPVATAAPLALMMLVGGIAASWWLDPGFGAAASVYVALTLLYSFRLKREPLVDVTAIAGLFAIRIVAGMLIIAHPLSLWLVTFTMFLFLSLALAKRTAELVQSTSPRRPVPGRGYLPDDRPLTLTIGIAAGTVSVIVMVLYMSVDAMPTGLYANRGPLFLIPVVLGLWIMRIWLRAHRGTLDDDPVIYALRDRGSWLHAAAVVGLWAMAAA